MSNRADFANVADEIMEYFFSENEIAVWRELRERIAVELHNAYVAGDERSPPALSIKLDGPGMAELRAAFEAAPDGGEIPFGIAFVAQALLNATRVVLGLDPPGIYEGPGIPELRLVLDTMPPALPVDGRTPDWLVRLHEAARVALGRPVEQRSQPSERS
jgi:hypothetical protein